MRNVLKSLSNYNTLSILKHISELIKRVPIKTISLPVKITTLLVKEILDIILVKKSDKKYQANAHWNTKLF